MSARARGPTLDAAGHIYVGMRGQCGFPRKYPEQPGSVWSYGVMYGLTMKGATFVYPVFE